MHRPWFSWAAALLALALLVSGAGARPRLRSASFDKTASRHSHQHGDAQSQRAGAPPGRLEPIIGPTSWYDALNDASGLSWLEQTQLLTDRVTLARTETLGAEVGAITALAEGPDGVLYMGTSRSELWSYDPVTGNTLDLGMPVPDECNN